MRTYRPSPVVRTATIAVLVIAGGSVLAQRSAPSESPSTSPSPPADVPAAEFQFARMIYRDAPGRARFGGGWWMQDWPDAEVHFRQAIERLTRVDIGDGVTIGLLDDHLFDYPWLYATQTGYWDLSDAEVARLREYLLRGGFLMADDFFGENEWIPFEQTMHRVFPEKPIIEIDVGTHEVLNVLYQVRQFTQIPGLRHLGGFGRSYGRGRRFGGGGRGGGNSYGGLPEPHLRAIVDDDGRLLVAMNYNQDVGDAWEHADDAFYPEPMTALAYRFGVNYLIYAMSH